MEATPTPQPLGIDLAKRGHEVRKLLFKGFGRLIVGNRLDPDDVTQEVFKALLVRNQGKCPWDSTKSSFGHYVHMVCMCVVNNILARRPKLQTVRDPLDIAARSRESGDTADGPALMADFQSYLLKQKDGHTMCLIINGLDQGKSLAEAGAPVGLNRYQAGALLPRARMHALEWLNSR